MLSRREARQRLEIAAASEVATDDVAAKGQGQAAGSIRPPFSEIDDLLQALLGIGELSLVDQQAGSNPSSEDLVLNPIERDHDVLHRRIEEAQRQKRRRHFTGDRNANSFERRRTIVPRNDDGTVAIAHAGAVRQQEVAIGQMRVRVKRHSA